MHGLNQINEVLTFEMTTTTTATNHKINRYYFQITDASVFECVHAVSFTEAKEKAYEGYAPLWNRIEWLNGIGEESVIPFDAQENTALPVTITK